MNIEKVIRENRCKSCGFCYSICPTNAIEMDYFDGFYRPIVIENKCIKCGKCVKNCPAENTFAENGLLGKYISLCLAHSTNTKIRHNATSGGVINTLVRFLLKEQIVDVVLMAGYSVKSKIETSVQLITVSNVDNLNEARNFSSRYVLTPVLTELKNLPVNCKKIAVVGTPCQIQALKLGGG